MLAFSLVCSFLTLHHVQFSTAAEWTTSSTRQGGLQSNAEFVSDILVDPEAVRFSNEYSAYVESLCEEIHGDNLSERFTSQILHPESILTPEQCRWVIYEAEHFAASTVEIEKTEGMVAAEANLSAVGESRDECQKEHHAGVDCAKAGADINVQLRGWTTSRHTYFPTTDNEISTIPALSYFLTNLVYTNVIPLFRRYFDIPAEILGIDEIFIVKYSSDGQRDLSPHQDGDDFSFVVSLSDPSDYAGGGTAFVGSGHVGNDSAMVDNDNEHVARGSVPVPVPVPVRAPLGSTLLFCGQNNHSGVEVTEGSRYVLAGFLSIHSTKYCADLYA